jgi:hypothetical protein
VREPGSSSAAEAAAALGAESAEHLPHLRIREHPELDALLAPLKPPGRERKRARAPPASSAIAKVCVESRVG